MLTKKIFTAQLLINWVTRILFFVSLAALLPAMPNYINDIGGTNAQIGIVMSAFALGVLVFRPLVGKKADDLGRRAVLIFGAVIFIISPIIYIFIESVNTLIPVRIFHGLGLAAFGTASITLITDAAPIENRGAVISYTGMINTIAFAFGPVLGYFIWDRWGYNALFGAVSALSGLCLIFSLLVKETKHHTISKNHVNYFQAIKQRRILVAASMILLIGMVHGGVMFYMPVFLKDMDVNIGLFFTVYGIAAFLIRLVIGPASDRLGRGPFLVFSLTLLTAGVFTLSQATGFALMILSAVFYGFGFGSYQPILTALVADNTTEETRGKIFSFYYGGFDLGISVAGLLLGAIAESYGIGNMFIMCVGITLTALVIFSTITEGSVSQSFRCAFTFQKDGRGCYICDQFQEVPPEEAEEYFKSES
ncbi:MFS transporter [candidate division KSB1 bacterium]|nr:MFS transporter [candidate division KSB1 bacterium]